MENLRKKPYTTQAEIDAMKKELENACRGKENSKPANFGAKKIAGTAIFVFILLMLCAILVNIWMDKAAGREASVFGFRIYNVETGSMEPTLPVGCYIVSKIPSDSTALQVGDIVTFQAEDMVVTHRIIEVIGEGNSVRYRTKGDYEGNSPDPWELSSNQIKAVYLFKIPLLCNSGNS